MAQDLVAIFHASFHPTKGNVIDWSFKARPEISLDAVEFSALPSGLHLIEQDVVYFTKPPYSGVCIFRRRRSSSPGHRGFKLSSLGVLLEKGVRPRAWKHVAALKELLSRIYELEEEGEDGQEEGQEIAREFFEAHRVRDGGDGEDSKWEGWSRELDGDHPQDLSNPTLHLPHLLRILGPSTMTLYKHVLARRRILIYTLPPVEAACMLCRVAGDMCFEVQAGDGEPGGGGKLKGKAKEPIAVLGMITLMDVDRLSAEGGWIACTTDAIFLEKPQYYDLLIDLTTSTPNRAARPAFYASKQTSAGWRLSTVRFSWSDVKLWTELDRILSLSPSSSCCDTPSCHHPPNHSNHNQNRTQSIMTSWNDVWRVYEDVCVLCAGLWMGAWRSGGSGGGVRLEGDDELVEEPEGPGGVYVRSVGMGIEGVPSSGSGSGEGNGNVGAGNWGGNGTGKKQRRASSLWSSPGTWGKSKVRLTSFSSSTSQFPSTTTTTPNRHASLPPLSMREQDLRNLRDTHTRKGQVEQEMRRGQEELTEDGVLISLSNAPDSAQRHVYTTLALLQTFHAHTCFQVGVLEGFLVREGLGRPPLPPSLPPLPFSSSSTSSPSSSSNPTSTAAGIKARSKSNGKDSERTLVLSPKDVLAFELGPLSGLDARYLEWFVDEFGEARVLVKRGWRDWVGLVW